MGPYELKLISHRFSRTMEDRTQKGQSVLTTYLSILSNPQAFKSEMLAAHQFVNGAIQLIQQSKGFDPTWDRERICREIVEGIERKIKSTQSRA